MYTITASFSILAYVWLVIVLMVLTPDVVELWEAAVTFGLFFVLIILAFAADKNWFRKMPEVGCSSFAFFARDHSYSYLLLPFPSLSFFFPSPVGW